LADIVNCRQAEGTFSSESGAKDLVFRGIFPQKEGYQMGVTYNDILPGGNSKKHSHPEEHITFIVKGKGRLECGEESKDFSEGYVLYIGANEPHCFYNTGDEPMVLFGITGPKV